MKTDERRKHLLEVLQNCGKIRVSTLINNTGYPPATVRRDLIFLEENGIVQRTHGYVEYKQPEVVPTEVFSAEVLRIAKKAAELVDDFDIILLDSGTTTLAMAYQLLSKKGLTVITNSIPIADLYSLSEQIQTYLTGGFLRVREAALVGDDTIDFLSKIRTKRLFLSTTGVRGTKGLTCVTPFQADVKCAMIKASEEVILLIDHHKFERDGLRVFASFDEINKIVTDRPIESNLIRSHLERISVEVIVAE